MTLGVVVLVVSVAPGVPRNPTRRGQQQQQLCTIPPYIRTSTRCHMYVLKYNQVPYAHDTWFI